LEGFGAWLRLNGTSLFGTRPWKQASTSGASGERIRFTSKGEDVYMLLLDPVDGEALVIPDFPMESIDTISRVDNGASLPFSLNAGTLRVEGTFNASEAYAFKISRR
jgi:alpha-L-fucosidase